MGSFGKYNFRFFGILTLDAAIIVALGLLAASGRLPAGRWPAIVILLLFATNVLVLRTVDFRSVRLPESAKRPRAVRLLILPSLYTFMGVVLLVSFVRHPSGQRGLQVLAGAVVTGFLWYLVYRIRQAGRSQVRK